jgi:hypothetical protein
VFWYHYVTCFFAGVFLTNGIPHFVHGISGDKFPTPFGKPPGKGLSPPFINVLWGLFNLVIGSFLLWYSKVSAVDILSIIVFFLGISAMSIRLSIVLSKKDRI